MPLLLLAGYHLLTPQRLHQASVHVPSNVCGNECMNVCGCVILGERKMYVCGVGSLRYLSEVGETVVG